MGLGVSSGTQPNYVSCVRTRQKIGVVRCLTGHAPREIPHEFFQKRRQRVQKTLTKKKKESMLDVAEM